MFLEMSSDAVVTQALWETDTLSGEATLQKLFYFSSEKGSILKEKNLLLEQIPFQKGLPVQESKQEITKVVSLVKSDRPTTIYPWSTKHIQSFYGLMLSILGKNFFLVDNLHGMSKPIFWKK